VDYVSPDIFPYDEKFQRSNLQLTYDAINWFGAFTLLTFAIFFLPYVVIAWTLLPIGQPPMTGVALVLLAFSGSMGVIIFLLGTLWMGGIKNIPRFSWREALTLKYSFIYDYL